MKTFSNAFFVGDGRRILTAIWRSTVKLSCGLSIGLSLSGCLPKETPLKEKSVADTAYAGFTGALTAQTLSASKVKVTWNQSTDPNVVAYNIYDSTLMFNPKLIKTVPQPSTEVTLQNLTTANYYQFRIRAVNKEKVEDSNTKDVGAIPYAGVLTAQVVNSSSAIIPFTDASNSDSVRIYCQVGTGTTWELLSTVTNTLTTQATLNDLLPGTRYTCRAALVISSFEDNNTFTTSFVPVGQASQMVFSTQPGSANAGSPLSQMPVITIKDVNDTVVTAGPDSNTIVTLTVSSASPTIGTVRGTASVAAVRGVATFSGINLQEAGLKVLTATKADTSSQSMGSGPLTVDSNQFNIAPGAVSATRSTIAISPAVPPNAALIANGSNSYTVNITLQDDFGNAVSGTKPTFASNTAGDTLTQPALNTNATGLSSGSISTTIADTSPARVLRITSPSGLTGVTTLAPFVPGPASKLLFTTQPVNSPAGAFGLATVRVAVADANNNIITSGLNSDATVSMAIAANTSGAILTGTSSMMAASGVAVFTDLGISKTQTGYKLLASSGSLTPAYSNSFNVTAGIPNKIVINGAANFVSGACSAAFTFQLQDNGNNPANAIQNTPITITGLSGASMYSASSCGGTALSPNITFTAGTNTKTVYLKGVKAEQLSLLASDPSSVLAPGSFTAKVSPNKITLLAEAPAPALPGTPLTVVAGRCSSAIAVIPAGDNGQPGPVFVNTVVTVTGVNGSSASLYSDSSCTQVVAPTAVTIMPGGGPAYTTLVYIKGPRAENLNLSVSDPSTVMTTMSANQSVSILASTLDLTGPTSVISGACSTAYTIKLMDLLGNLVPAPANTNLTINGLAGTNTGRFYTSPSCAGAPLNSTVTVPAAVSTIQIFFKDTTAETLTVSVSDPTAKMTDSQSITIGISPSAFQITRPVAGTSKTSVCTGPFTVNTMDGAGNVTAAIANITTNLTGAGSGGTFFSDSQCTTSVTQFTFTTGQNAKQFWFKGQYPQASLTFTASDAAGVPVLTAGTAAWIVTAAPAFIGTAGSMSDQNGDLYWFQTGTLPVASRMDGPSSVQYLKFDSTKQFLYITDLNRHRILKFDYVNRTYVGWIGKFVNWGSIGVSGSNLATPSTALCQATVHNTPVPGWCMGGQSEWDGNVATGSLRDPYAVVEDGTYIYVSSRGAQAVSRFNAQTGAFDGYIGTVGSTPTSAGTNGPSSCTLTSSSNPTPGWCKGGSNGYPSYSVPFSANGRLVNPRALAIDSTYLYVASYGSVNRYLLTTGAFDGWTGMVATTPTGGYHPDCATTGANSVTPGWCLGGASKDVDPRYNPGGLTEPTGMMIAGTTLYVVSNWHGNTVSTFDVTTGSSTGNLSGLTYSGWGGAQGIATDGTYLYFADNSRVVRTDLTGSVVGWLGKVNNPNSMAGTGCTSLSTNSNTPGWCSGGSAKEGMDEGAFHNVYAIDIDGDGNLVTGQGSNYPGIKRFSSTTGAYSGMLAAVSTSPREWSNDATAFAGFHGFDDYSLNVPAGIHNDGTHLYIADYNAARVKKVTVATGATVGWLGAITSTPTSGGASCVSANPMSSSPGWCLGANYQPRYIGSLMVSYANDGVFNGPVSSTTDSLGNLFVVDYNAHRILKYNSSTGAFIGWIGRINGSPGGGAAGCNGAANGTFTPGWCTGGSSQSGSGDGHLNVPTGIVHHSGKLYVVDRGNSRIMKYDASSGAFDGWIGRISTGPQTGCTSSNNGNYDYSNGWCKGGTTTAGYQGSDRGGGFNFWGNYRSGITTDGTYIYIANFYNYRIDRWSLAGVYQGAVSARLNNFTNVWVPAASQSTIASMSNNIGCDYPMALWTDSSSGSLYGTSYNICGFGSGAAWKLDRTTGNMLGWQGAISFSNSPTGGDTSCSGATGVTPGWCRGGGNTDGYRLGGFTSAIYGITGDANFVYISDGDTHRITRLPK